MTKDFHETYSEQEAVLPSERSTGFVFAGVCAIVGAFYWDNPLVLAVCAVLSLSFVIVSLAAPFLLGPLNRVWFRFSLLVNKIVNPVILGLMFMVAIVPVGLIMRLMRELPARSLLWTTGPLIICRACDRFDSFERSHWQAISRCGWPKIFRK